MAYRSVRRRHFKSSTQKTQKEHTHAGEYLFAQRSTDGAGTGLYLCPGGAGTVPELFHPEHCRPVHRRLLHIGLRGSLSGGFDRPPHSGTCCSHGGRCVLRLCHGLFADPAWRGEHHGRHHRQHRPLHHQSGRDGLFLHHVAGQDRHCFLAGKGLTELPWRLV